LVLGVLECDVYWEARVVLHEGERFEGPRTDNEGVVGFHVSEESLFD
jgi:hypothetical protein